jgi:aminopeptidase YwaD
MSIDVVGVVRGLSDDIGSRVAGSKSEAAAATYLLDLLERERWECEVTDFEYRGWRADTNATLQLLSSEPQTAVMGFALPYTLPTSPRGVEGTLVDGRRATIIPDRIICDRFYIQAANGHRIGRVLVEPYSDLRPIPNPRATDSLPTIVVSNGQVSVLREAATKAMSVRLLCPEGEFLAYGRNMVINASGRRDSPGLLLVAHYDSVAGSPGANDNASGVAVALAVMEHARRVGYTMRLLLSAAEELMFRGAEAYLAQLQDDGRTDEIQACLCLDMLGVGDTLKLRAPRGGLWYRAGLDFRGESFLDRERPSSDHWIFHQIGLPSAQLTRQFDPNYHSPRDTSCRILPETLSEAAFVACGLLDVVTPQLKKSARSARGEG